MLRRAEEIQAERTAAGWLTALPRPTALTDPDVAAGLQRRILADWQADIARGYSLIGMLNEDSADLLRQAQQLKQELTERQAF